MSAAPQGLVQHPELGTVPYRLDVVSDDPDEQVSQVIEMMRGYAVEDARSPVIQAQAHGVIQEYGEPLSGVWQHVGSRMRFVQDEETAAPIQAYTQLPIVETLVRPVDIATGVAIGDCDDYTMYGASLLTALQIPCAFVTVAADARDPRMFSHVYLVAYPTTGPYKGQRIPLDCSHGPYPGWEVADRFGKRAEWPLTGGLACLAQLALVAIAGVAVQRFWRGAR